MKKDKEEKVDKKRERIFDFFWTLEEQHTILGLLKGRKMKKELKKKLKAQDSEHIKNGLIV